MSSFSHPTLSRQEIATALQTCNVVEIDDTDLANPNSQLVIVLFTAILTHLFFLKEDSQLDFRVLDRFDNPDAHQDSIRAVELFCKMKEVLSDIGFPLNFGLDDLLRPDSSRTLKILSALTNFLLYKHNIMNSLEEVYHEVSRLEEKEKEDDARISQLNEEIAECNKAFEAQLPLVHEVEAKVKQLRQTIPSLNNHQATLRSSLQKMKEKAKEIDEKISKAKFEVIQSEQEKSDLMSKIVQSPDKLQRALEEKKEILTEAKDTEKLFTQRFNDKSGLLEVYTEVYKKMEKLFSQMEALQEEVISAKSMEKSVKQLKAKLKDDKVLHNSLEARQIELQGRVKQLDENKRQLEKDRNNRFEECQAELTSFKRDLDSLRQDLAVRRRDIEAILAEVDSVASKINLVEDSGAAKQRALFQKGEMVLNELYQYWRSIEAALKIEAGRNFADGLPSHVHIGNNQTIVAPVHLAGLF